MGDIPTNIQIGEHLGLNSSEAQCICAVEPMSDGKGWWVHFGVETRSRYPSAASKIDIPADCVMGILAPLNGDLRPADPPWRH